jgi:hypothetical protein
MVLAAVVATASSSVEKSGGTSLLRPQAFVPLPVGSITPSGWLLEQLKIQAEGLSGHLAMFYPSIADSWWVGGTQDQGGMIYQQAPYWLNGFLPLAYQLKNAGIETLHPKCGGSAGHHGHGDRFAQSTAAPPSSGIPVSETVRPLQQVRAYIDGIMARVQPSGWIGPAPKVSKRDNPTSTCAANVNLFGGDLPGGGAGKPGTNSSGCADKCRANSKCFAYVFRKCGRQATCWLKRGGWKVQQYKEPAGCALCSQIIKKVPQRGDGDIYWGPTNAMLSLLAYAEAERLSNVTLYQNVTKTVLRHFLAQKTMMETTPLASWAAARWTDMALSVLWLIDHGIGTPTEREVLFKLGQMLHSQGTDWDQCFESNLTASKCKHNVNVAQAIKSSGVWYRFSGNTSMRRLSLQRMANLDEWYGLPTGMFNGDELVPTPPTRNPSRGIETGGVVEAMFSWTCLGATIGDTSFFDRVERIAFNALPAAWASPRGGDM